MRRDCCCWSCTNTQTDTRYLSIRRNGPFSSYGIYQIQLNSTEIIQAISFTQLNLTVSCSIMCLVPFIRKNIVVFHPEKIPFKNIFIIITLTQHYWWPSVPASCASEATHIHHTRNLKLSHLNGLQPSLMLSVTPVFFLLRHVMISAVNFTCLSAGNTKFTVHCTVC